MLFSNHDAKVSIIFGICKFFGGFFVSNLVTFKKRILSHSAALKQVWVYSNPTTAVRNDCGVFLWGLGHFQSLFLICHLR